MNMNAIFTLVFFTSALFCLDYVNSQNYNKCGSKLAQLVDGICQGIYYSPLNTKKSKDVGSPYHTTNQITDLNQENQEEDDMRIRELVGRALVDQFNREMQEERNRNRYYGRFQSRASALDMFPSKRSNTGIASECCSKSCSYKEIISYCG